MRRLAEACALVALAIAAAGPVAAQAQDDVDLQLVLAVDVSHSMDYQEQELQRDGYVAAFRDPEVIRAIRQGARGRIAVTYLEWSGADTQQVVVPWTLIDGAAAAEAFAVRLATQAISRGHTTSISGVLAFAARHFEEAPFRSGRRVIDISGDGINNSGPPVDAVRDRIVADGVVINGLPILDGSAPDADSLGLAGLDLYYTRCVVGGGGAFVIPVRNRGDFASATKQKLLLEISDLAGEPRLLRAQHAPPEQHFNCRTGGWHRQRPESRWYRWCVAAGICEAR